MACSIRGGRWTRGLGGFAVLFGLLTIKSGADVLFLDAEAAAAAGNYVPFVLWFNFLAGFVYVLAGVGLWARRNWAVPLSAALAVSTLGVFAALGVAIALGTPYEMRTVGAMALRSAVWAGIAATACGRLAGWRARPST